MYYLISSTEKDEPLTDDTLIREDAVDLDPYLGAIGAIGAYNRAHPDRKAISAAQVLPGTSEDRLRETYPRHHQGGYWVSPVPGARRDADAVSRGETR